MPSPNFAASMTPAPHSLGLRRLRFPRRAPVGAPPPSCPAKLPVRLPRLPVCFARSLVTVLPLCRVPPSSLRSLSTCARISVAPNASTPRHCSPPGASHSPALPTGTVVGQASGGLGRAHGPAARRIRSHDDAGCGLLRKGMPRKALPSISLKARSVARQLLLPSCRPPSEWSRTHARCA